MTVPNPDAFQAGEEFARHLDAIDPLRDYRAQFLIPRRPDGSEVSYFCGNSLGLQPRTVCAHIQQELDDWANLAVEAHFVGRMPWYVYQESFREAGARLVGGQQNEVVFMNGLTVNLHLLMLTFYQPTAERFRILTDEPTFPSDRYALVSQIQQRGFDPTEALLAVRPRTGEHVIRHEDIEQVLAARGREIALVLFNGVNFFTGQCFDLTRITAAAQRQGCVVGFDLAHAAGNVELRLHDWNVDFAVWCTYKYLNSGPGAVAGCFVHERHGNNLALPRLAGWWGNDPDARFRMHLEPEFIARAGADGWQLSNPPILALAPVRASLDIFAAAGITALRAKSERLTGYLQYLLDQLPPGHLEVITPRPAAERGCQLSILVHEQPCELLRVLTENAIVCDFRAPNVIRVAPVPLYNTFAEVWRFVQVLARQLKR